MMTSVSAIPDEICYHFTEKLKVIGALTSSPCISLLLLAIEYFRTANRHLKKMTR